MANLQRLYTCFHCGSLVSEFMAFRPESNRGLYCSVPCKKSRLIMIKEVRVAPDFESGRDCDGLEGPMRFADLESLAFKRSAGPIQPDLDVNIYGPIQPDLDVNIYGTMNIEKITTIQAIELARSILQSKYELELERLRIIVTLPNISADFNVPPPMSPELLMGIAREILSIDREFNKPELKLLPDDELE